MFYEIHSCHTIDVYTIYISLCLKLSTCIFTLLSIYIYIYVCVCVCVCVCLCVLNIDTDSVFIIFLSLKTTAIWQKNKCVGDSRGIYSYFKQESNDGPVTLTCVS